MITGKELIRMAESDPTALYCLVRDSVKIGATRPSRSDGITAEYEFSFVVDQDSSAVLCIGSGQSLCVPNGVVFLRLKRRNFDSLILFRRTYFCETDSSLAGERIVLAAFELLARQIDADAGKKLYEKHNQSLMQTADALERMMAGETSAKIDAA